MRAHLCSMAGDLVGACPYLMLCLVSNIGLICA